MIRKIALEEHFSLPETLGEAIQSKIFADSWPELRRRLLDLNDERLTQMDKNGIELMILSLNSPAVQGIPETGRAVDTARRANDVLAEGIAKRPDRFAGFAALPMQDPEEAVTELVRSVKELGLKGANVNGFSQVGTLENVVYCDNPVYFPLWAKFQELQVPFYLHPRDPLPAHSHIYDGHPWLRGATWAFGVETATHALRLMGSGLFDRFPGLTIILGHLGEGLPAGIWRIDHRIQKGPMGIPAKRSMADYLRSNFYLTTSGNFRTQTLIDAMLEVGADRILFSMDYPFEEMGDAAEWFDDTSIAENDRLKIARTNAAVLFRLPDPLSPSVSL